MASTDSLEPKPRSPLHEPVFLDRLEACSSNMKVCSGNSVAPSKWLFGSNVLRRLRCDVPSSVQVGQQFRSHSRASEIAIRCCDCSPLASSQLCSPFQYASFPALARTISRILRLAWFRLGLPPSDFAVAMPIRPSPLIASSLRFFEPAEMPVLNTTSNRLLVGPCGNQRITPRFASDLGHVGASGHFVHRWYASERETRGFYVVFGY